MLALSWSAVLFLFDSLSPSGLAASVPPEAAFESFWSAAGAEEAGEDEGRTSLSMTLAEALAFFSARLLRAISPSDCAIALTPNRQTTTARNATNLFIRMVPINPMLYFTADVPH